MAKYSCGCALFLWLFSSLFYSVSERSHRDNIYKKKPIKFRYLKTNSVQKRNFRVTDFIKIGLDKICKNFVFISL